MRSAAVGRRPESAECWSPAAICWSTVSRPTARTSTVSAPSCSTAPATTRSPGRHDDGLGLAGEQGHPDLPAALDHDPVGGQLLTRAHVDEVARPERLDRHRLEPAAGRAPGGARHRRRERHRRLRGAPASAGLEQPAGEQQRHQHRERVEVPVASRERGCDPVRVEHGHRKGDGEIQVEHAMAQPRPRAAEERRGTPERHRRGEDERGPAEEPGPGRVHAVPPPRVDRGGEEHDVHRGEARDAEPEHQVPVGRRLLAQGAGPVSQRGDAAGQGAEPGDGGVPPERGAPGGVAHRRFDDSGRPLEHPLGDPDAGGAA